MNATAADRFMLLIWDLTCYARFSESVSVSQYNELADLYWTIWPVERYESMTLVALGA